MTTLHCGLCLQNFPVLKLLQGYICYQRFTWFPVYDHHAILNTRTIDSIPLKSERYEFADTCSLSAFFALRFVWLVLHSNGNDDKGLGYSALLDVILSCHYLVKLLVVLFVVKRRSGVRYLYSRAILKAVHGLRNTEAN